MRLNKVKRYEHILVLLCYTLLTLLMTYPLILNFFTHVPGGGDAFQNLWNLWWVRKSIVDLSTSPYYTDYLFYPTGISLTFHTLSLFNSLLAIPLQEIFGLVASYNILFIFGFVLSGYGTYLLVKYLTKDTKASFISGLIFAFCPYHFAHAFNGHLNLVSTEWIPFYVLFLIKTHEEDGNKNAVLAGISLFLISLCSWHYMGFMIIFTGFFILYQFWFNRNELNINFLKRFILLMLVFSVLILPFIYPMLMEILSGNYTTQRIDFAATFSADLLGFFVPSQLHPIFGNYVKGIYSHFNGNIAEHTHFVGYTVICLSLYYLVKKGQCTPWLLGKMSKARQMFREKINIFKLLWIIFFVFIIYYFIFGRDFIIYLLLSVYSIFFVMLYYVIKERQIGFWFLSIIFFFLLSLGPFLHILGEIYFGSSGLLIPLPYILLYIVPSLSFIRDPGRFGILLMLSLAVLSGFSLRYIFERVEKKKILLAMISGLILFEFLAVPYPMVETQIPEFYKDISKNKEEFAILEVPIPSFFNSLSRYMYYQTTHEKKIIGGLISITPSNARVFMENTPVIQGFRFPVLLLHVNDKIFVIKNAYFRPEREYNPLLKMTFANKNVSFQMEDGSGYYIDLIPNGTFIASLNQSYSQGDIIRQNISEIGQSVLNYYGIKYIVIHENDLATEARRAVNSLVSEILHDPSPVYVDEEITVYKVSEAKKVPFAVLRNNWYIKETWEDPPMRWMKNNATIDIINAEAGNVKLRFEAKSFKKDRILEVYLNNKLIDSYSIGMNFTKIEIDNLDLIYNRNTISFYTPHGCEEHWVHGISFVDDGKRCISIAFQNISIQVPK